MRFASLGSGSRGNALVVEAGTTRLLLDCGFGLRECRRRLARLAIDESSLDGILVTHEHGDHLAGVDKLARHAGLPVWLTHGAFSTLAGKLAEHAHYRLIDSHNAFSIGDIQIQPFPVPHDAREPVQYVFSDGQRRLGVLTDVGQSTPCIVDMLKACDALFLECNHDAHMLENNPAYPAVLKQRIAGRFGHLENLAAAALLASLETASLQHVVAAHLSEQNNRPELARAALSSVLSCSQEWIAVADQENGLAWRQIV